MLVRAVFLASVTATASVDCAAQGLTRFSPVGSASESFRRYAQSLDSSATDSWAVRRLRVLPDSGSTGRGSLDFLRLPVVGRVWYSSDFPFGSNDGAVWVGRGVNAAVDGGIHIAWQFGSVTLNPLAFISENRTFAILSPANSAAHPLADPAPPPLYIDRPQRFGTRAYGAIDGGQSSVELNWAGVNAGISTANQWFGPMSEWPYTLGNNAAGVPHAFIGSQAPWRIRIGRANWRLFYGGLSQSSYSIVPDSVGGRFITGVVASFVPAFIPSLEVGGARIFQYPWPASGFGWRELRKPLEGLLKDRVPGDSSVLGQNSIDNQLASIFFRWTATRHGFEVYGEYARNDHNWNGRDAILEPDHSAAYGLGFRKAWRRDSSSLTGLRAEIISLDPSTLHRARPQGSHDVYTHFATKQGHTQRGQILGAGPFAVDGAGQVVALEYFDPRGATHSYSLRRLVVRERLASPFVDVQHALAAQRERKIRYGFVSYGVTLVHQLNRNFSRDAWNLLLTSGIRW